MSQLIRNTVNYYLGFFGIKLLRLHPVERRAKTLFSKYKNSTMVPFLTFRDNLKLVYDYGGKNKGIVVECGVWRAGMTAAIAEILKEKDFYLFDSFEGLPEVKEIDGKSAKKWQKNFNSPKYRDNCRAEIDEAKSTMEMIDVNFILVKGWFIDTLPEFKFNGKIDVLRLDGDWYDSTMQCLENLYPKVRKGGLIIIDDYFTWDGCCKAVHDYLSMIKSSTRIRETEFGVCFLIKDEE